MSLNSLDGNLCNLKGHFYLVYASHSVVNRFLNKKTIVPSTGHTTNGGVHYNGVPVDIL